MANEQRKSMSLVRAKDAKPLSLTMNSIWRTREVKIYWDADNLVLAEDAVRYLNEYASTLNKQEKRSFVDNPFYGTEKLDGRFRNVGAQLTKHEQKPAIVQTLREDWITELPTLEKDDDEVRMMGEGTGADPLTGDTTLMRRWPNIDPDYAEDILIARKATQTVTDPQVDIWDKEDLRRSKKVYAGKFAVTRLGLQDQEDGAKQLVEGLLQVHVVDALSDLLALTPRLTQENEIFDLFAPNEAPGEGDTLAFTFYNIDLDSRPFLMDKATDAELVTYIAQKGGAAWATGASYEAADIVTNGGSFYICLTDHTAGATFAGDSANWTSWHDWNYASKKFVEQEDNTGRFYILFREVAWEAWGHDHYAFDSISYGNAGATNLSESRQKKYTGITSDDIEEATAALRANTNWIAWGTTTAYVLNAQVSTGGKYYICATAHTSGTFSTDLAAGKWVEEASFIIIDVRVDFNPQNGSCSLTQTVIEQIVDEDEDGKVQLAPHALKSGLATIQTTNWTNFNKTGSSKYPLPAGTACTAGSDIISNIASIQGNGLWSRLVKTRIPVWTNTWASAIMMGVSEAGGFAVTESLVATGVPESGRAAAVTASKVASGATRVVVSARQGEGSDGERIISSKEKLVNTVGTREPDKIIAVQRAPGNNGRFVARIWYRNDAAAVAVLTHPTTGKAAIDFNYTTDIGVVSFTHKIWRSTDHGDGTETITQTGAGFLSSAWATPIDTDDEILEEAHETPVRISGAEIWEVKLMCTFRQVFNTQQLAANYAAADDDAGGAVKIFDDKHGSVEYRRSQVQYLGNDRWAGRRVCFRPIGTNPIWNVENP